MTFPRTCTTTFFSWLVILTVCIGCGQSGPETIAVTGTVTLDGAPLPEAGVMFAGPGGGTPVSAVTDAQGQFRLKALVGENAVAVSKTKQASGAAAKPANPDDVLMPAAGRRTTPESETAVPLKYSDPRKSGLKVDVKKGMPTVKLSLDSK